MEKVKVKIYKPEIGKVKPLARSTQLQFENMLLKNAGGYTKHDSKLGVWLDAEGNKVYDRVYVYEMIVDNNPSIIANLRAQALVIKQEMQQDCVLFTIEPMLEVEFVE